ncbi:CTP synthase [Sporolactobacillus inulinus]|uniref:CTP synthase (glutamine hydrolyzing) n=1 Tax=Sporolactobacillus inulinus TaxID=2078 RepID=A0A4Y1ZFK7_9BACL|nr:CTP synthase [Sporolactobacillus inulinus]
MKLNGADSAEFNQDCQEAIIDLLPEQLDIEDLGGTLRLGLYPCKIVKDTKVYQAYHEEIIYQRHRHRYEFNNQYRQKMSDHGMVFSGVSPDDRLVEMIELKDHPWFVACQFHPEFKSRPTRPEPLFHGFIKASLENK